MDKLSYALGLSMGQNFKMSGVATINVDDFAQALKAVYENTEKKMSYDEAKTVVQDYFKQLESSMADNNEKAGKQYLGKALEIGGPVELEAAGRDLLDEHLALAGALLAHQCAHRVVEGLLLVAPFVVVVATGHGKEQAQDQDENDV